MSPARSQCDFWFLDITLPARFGQARTATQLPALTVVTVYAHWASGVLVPTRHAEDVYVGWWQLIAQFEDFSDVTSG